MTKKHSWIGEIFFLDLLHGLSLTLRYMFARTVTHMYPDHEKWIPYSRHRGHHFIKTNDEGDVNCVACELCSKICPCDCIIVIPYEDAKGNRRPKVFDIDLARCLYCGLCEDACPADAIKLGQEYEISATTTEALVVHLEDLVAAPGKARAGGQVVPAKLITPEKTANDIRPRSVPVEDTLKASSGYDWWQRIRKDK